MAFRRKSIKERLPHYMKYGNRKKIWFNRKDRICGIYKVSSPSGKIYIGQSTDILLRWHHYKILQNSRQVKLYASFLKHGVDAHKFEILRICENKLLNKLEKHYVDLYKTFRTKNGLNLRDGGGSRASFKKRPKNILIKCACGCGNSFLKFDTSNRPRKYVAGHNPIKRPLEEAILVEIKKGKKTIDDFIKSIPKNKQNIKSTLCRLTRKGIVVRVKWGQYAPSGTPIFKNYKIKCACGCGTKFYKHDSGGRPRNYVSGHNMKSHKK